MSDRIIPPVAFDAVENFDLRTLKYFYAPHGREETTKRDALNRLLCIVQEEATDKKERTSFEQTKHPLRFHRDCKWKTEPGGVSNNGACKDNVADESDVAPAQTKEYNPEVEENAQTRCKEGTEHAIDSHVFDAIQNFDLRTLKKLYVSHEQDKNDQLDEVSRLLKIVEKEVIEGSKPMLPPQQRKPRGDSDSDSDSDCYELNGKPGCVLIISNGCGGDRKKASVADLDMMHELWVKTIGCELHDPEEESIPTAKVAKINKLAKVWYRNQNARDINYLLKTLAETQKEYSYLVIVISTHGGLVTESFVNECEELEKKYGKGDAKKFAEKCRKARNEYLKQRTNGANGEDGKPKENLVPVFYGEDWMPVREIEIIKMFDNEHSHKFVGKPKLFILDYCRTIEDIELEAKKAGPSGQARLTSPEQIPPMPVSSDMVSVYATHHSFPAFNNEEGSWLVRSIKEVFGEHYKKKNVDEMLTKVNRKMKDRCIEYIRRRQGMHPTDPKVKVAMSKYESSLDGKFNLYDEGQ